MKRWNKFKILKAKLVENITKQLRGNYDKQVQNLNEQLKQTVEINNKTKEETSLLYKKELELKKHELNSISQQYERQVSNFTKPNEQNSRAKTQIEDLEKQLLRAKSFSQINWKVVLVAIAIGVLLGKLFHIG